ncbi:MAG: glycoside hydrolase family 11 protein [Oscillospiraceae bacterium]|jgi:endo-1,4-beta-xylanase|nr:glycoside hydrolase family 11 protein [Oscillospiraceae bacterium]
MKKRIVLYTVILGAFLLPLSVMAITLAEPITITANMRSSVDGFNFEFWIQNSGEDASMTLTGGGTYECEWDDVFNVLFRTGRRLGSTMPHYEYGEITIDYAAEFTIKRGDVFYLCVYGWTEEPLIEWYIIESRGNYKPPGRSGISHGIVEIDGGFYEIFESTRVEEPSIIGNTTFQQYWSVRMGNRTEGTISVSEHFRAWEEAGLDMSGNMYEVALCIEGFRSSGNARVTRHILTIGDDVYGADTEKLETDWEERFSAGDELYEEDDASVTPADEPAEPAEIYDDVPAVPAAAGFALIYIAGGAAVLAIIAGILVFFAAKRKK